MGSVPAAVCEVTDTEDGDFSFPATLSEITGDLAAYGLGQQTASCSYTDGGGQVVSASVTYSIVDTTKPVITLLSRTPAANAFGWNNSAVTLTWSCSDEGGSGVVETPVSKILNLEGEESDGCRNMCGSRRQYGLGYADGDQHRYHRARHDSQRLTGGKCVRLE